MYGWRSKIGILVVASDTTCEAELHKAAPEGISIHSSRMEFPGAVTVESVGKLADYAEKAAELLIPAGVNVIAFCCTSGSFIKGAGWDLEIINKLEKRFPNIKATTTSTAVLNALRTLNIGKVAVATPYLEEVNKSLKSFLEKEKFNVRRIKGLQIKEDLETNALPAEKTYQLAKSLAQADADGILISCTSLRTFDIIGTIERDLGMPVVTSNQATLWDVLRKAEIRGPLHGYGQLLTRL
ncbi:MAG: maleate cis-trans isomerase [Candidatus Bathyarchaeia archaeon]